MEGQSEDQARARGEEIRDELTAKLRTGGPQSAAELHPQMSRDVSLSEVAFQLDRLAEEKQVIGEAGGAYRLA